MEDKTLLEELLERSPDERMHKRKMDKAYQLMTMGFRDEADALFDEILAEEPFNRDAMTGKSGTSAQHRGLGKKLIERQKAVENRLDNLAARARTSIPEPKPGAAPEEPSETEENAPVCEPRLKLLRSKKVRAVLVALFVAAFLAALWGAYRYGFLW